MKRALPWILIGVLAAAGIGYAVYASSKPAVPGKYGTFAQCLKDKGLKFYGAYWCPHCQNQKKEFGKSEKLLPYIECSTPDGKSQTQVCKDANVDGYPTWEYPDGTRDSGEVPLATLSEKSGCALPA